jgi:hypothetical protein
MRRLLMAVLLVVGAMGFSTGAALADNGTGNGNGTDVFKYSVSYTDVFGPVTCTGVHQIGKNFPGNATSGGQDSFTCTSSTGLPLTGGATPGLAIPLLPGQWFSDYFAQPSVGSVLVLNTKPFTLTISSDVFSYSGVAAYF